MLSRLGGLMRPQAWVAAHVALAVAVRMMGEAVGGVNGVRTATSLLQSVVMEAHRRLIEVHFLDLNPILHPNGTLHRGIYFLSTCAHSRWALGKLPVP